MGERKEMAAKEVMKAVRDGRARSRFIAVDSLTVSYPQSVKSHRMTSLQAKTIFAAQKSRTASGPGEESLLERDRLRKGKDSAKVKPDLLCKRAVKDEMAKGLGGRTGMTKEAFRSKVKDTCTKGQHVHDQLIPRFTVSGKERTSP